MKILIVMSIIFNYAYTVAHYSEIMKRNATIMFHFVAMFIAVVFNIVLAAMIVLMLSITFYISIKEKKSFIDTLRSYEK